MNDIAIYFEKFDLGNEMYAFKPINIIRGTYDEKENLFFTEAGIYCSPISGGNPFEQDFFGYQTTINRLKEAYGSENDDQTLLEEYFSACTECCYIGFYDLINGGIELLNLYCENFESDKELQYDGENEESVNIKYQIDKEYLQSLRECKNIREVRKMLDSVLNIDSGKKETEKIKEKSQPKAEQSIQLKKDIITLKELREEVLSQIVAQDIAVNDITRGIMKNQSTNNPRIKSHILVTGPTGTGKTEIVKIICKTLGLPFFEADATAYTEEGYVGKSVYSMLKGLINAANGDKEFAQKGILVIDEIDKKILSGPNDRFGLSVLFSLLKIMDRGIIELDTDRDNHLYFDASDLTIIFMGAFEQLYQNKIRENKHGIGFTDKSFEISNKNVIITKNDLINGGTPGEFLGRIGNVTSTQFFNQEDLETLLKKSKISPLLLQQEYFKEAFDTDLLYSNDYINEIAKKALESKTNARELKPLVDDSLKYATDELLSGKKVKVLTIDKETIIDPRNYHTK